MRFAILVLLAGVAAVSGCAPILPGWKVSAAVGPRCQRHRGLVVTDADGALREFEHPRDFIPAWNEDEMAVGKLQLVRGEGGWWVANKGSRPERGSGELLWFADGEARFTRGGGGSYVGVVHRGGETFCAERGMSCFGSPGARSST